jgi:hypothetical protein
MSLPKLLTTKIYKTGQTRGADDDEIYQNRVSRSSTVLIPYSIWDESSLPPNNEDTFQNGFIALIKPIEYFGNPNITNELQEKGLVLGENALIFYKTREEWNTNNPEGLRWSPADSRTPPLGGKYVARIAGITAVGGERISKGFNTSKLKGAGIRLFEYASKTTIKDCRTQLEAIFWLCHNSIDTVVEFGLEKEAAQVQKDKCLKEAKDNGLLDLNKLKYMRMINDGVTICPLCLKPLSAYGFFSRMLQAAGREVHDLTITEINLFHIKELRYGEFNHSSYNLGWGHHHCNVVVKDAGIDETIEWMDSVLEENIKQGHFKK